MKAWEEEQRSKLSTYCNRVELLGKFIQSRLASGFVRNKIGSFVKPWGIIAQGNSFSVQVKAKIHWLASSTGILKNALHKSITVNDLLSVGMDASRIWGLRTTGCQGLTMFPIAWGLEQTFTLSLQFSYR